MARTCDLLIAEFEAPRDPVVAAWGRQVPVLLHERLSRVAGIRARLSLDGRLPKNIRPTEVVLEGAVRGGEEVTLGIRLVRGARRAPLLARDERFKVRDLFARLDALAADVARALGAPPPLRVEGRPRGTNFTALRDYIRAIDLSDELDDPLELEDRRRKLEWLLLAVEADPSFVPAADALLEAGLRAHECGLVREGRHALELLSRLAPRDVRVPYALGELLLLDGAVDQAAACFRRCLAREPGHPGASLRLGILADEEGDREAAKDHFRVAGAGAGAGAAGSVEALLLLGILHAEDGDREAAGAAWRRAAELDPEGLAGRAARLELERAGARPEGRKRRRRAATRKR